MSTYEAVSLMITFAILVVAILEFRQPPKKPKK